MISPLRRVVRATASRRAPRLGWHVARYERGGVDAESSASSYIWTAPIAGTRLQPVRSRLPRHRAWGHSFRVLVAGQVRLVQQVARLCGIRNRGLALAANRRNPVNRWRAPIAGLDVNGGCHRRPGLRRPRAVAWATCDQCVTCSAGVALAGLAEGLRATRPEVNRARARSVVAAVRGVHTQITHVVKEFRNPARNPLDIIQTRTRP